MARSMTGFGRAVCSVGEYTVTVELKAVNHRFLEFSSRVPRGCAFLEEKLKSFVSTKVFRGKVDMFVTMDASLLGDTVIEINKPYAEAYIKALKDLSKTYKIKYDVSVSSISRNPEIFNIKKSEINEDEVWDIVRVAADEAINAFIDMKAREGKRLVDDVLSRIEFIKEKVAFIEKRSPQTVVEYREKLEQRMRDLIGDVNIDEQRLITETGIIADKLAVCEETVRLGSHMQELSSLLNSDEAIGRKLDFIVQEMNRETNTIGSKAQDVEILRAVVDIKSEIEKIREQIQNIE